MYRHSQSPPRPQTTYYRERSSGKCGKCATCKYFVATPARRFLPGFIQTPAQKSFRLGAAGEAAQPCPAWKRPQRSSAPKAGAVSLRTHGHRSQRSTGSGRSIQALDQSQEPNVTGNEPAGGDVLMNVQSCARCDDCRWVCENHNDRPWLGERGCGGAGAPCPICNAADAATVPEMPDGFQADVVNKHFADDQ
jgi:hypothetical protein